MTKATLTRRSIEQKADLQFQCVSSLSSWWEADRFRNGAVTEGFTS